MQGGKNFSGPLTVSLENFFSTNEIHDCGFNRVKKSAF